MRILCAVLLPFVYTGSLLAQPITVRVTGTVESATYWGSFGFGDLGTEMVGYCTFDPDLTPDSSAVSQQYGRYIGVAPMVMEIGSYKFEHSPAASNPGCLDVYVTDVTYIARSSNGRIVNAKQVLPYEDISLELFSLCNSQTSGLNDHAPHELPDLSWFNYRRTFRISRFNAMDGLDIKGRIDSVQAIVPEPTTLIIMAAGTLAASAINRRRRKPIYG